MLRGILGADGEAPQGAHLRRGDRRGGAALAPLHPGAAAARQGGEPARHRLRARRDQPERDAGGDRGHARRDRGAREREGGARSAEQRPRRRRRGAHRRDRRRDRRAAGEARGARSRMGDRAGASSTRSAACARASAAGEATRPSRGEADAAAEHAAPTTRRPAIEPPRTRASSCARSSTRSRRIDPETAHDLRACRRAGGRLGGLRLDRHPGRPHGQGRGRRPSCSSPTSSTSASSARRTACR